jgi:hypothetical protein
MDRRTTVAGSKLQDQPGFVIRYPWQEKRHPGQGWRWAVIPLQFVQWAGTYTLIDCLRWTPSSSRLLASGIARKDVATGRCRLPREGNGSRRADRCGVRASVGAVRSSRDFGSPLRDRDLPQGGRLGRSADGLGGLAPPAGERCSCWDDGRLTDGCDRVLDRAGHRAPAGATPSHVQERRPRWSSRSPYGHPAAFHAGSRGCGHRIGTGIPRSLPTGQAGLRRWLRHDLGLQWTSVLELRRLLLQYQVPDGRVLQRTQLP